MRILLTGASGQVGGSLKVRLSGHDVVAPDRKAFDLEQSETIVPFIDRVRPHLIINCAAYTAVDEAEQDRQRAAQINGIAPGLIAAAAKAAGAGLIHFSTDYVFDGLAKQPYRETDSCIPLNAYGRTKLQGEQAIAAAGGEYLIVRTSWIYAAAGKNFLMTMLRLGAERPSLRVVVDQTGTPTSANAVASMMAAIVTQMGDAPTQYLRQHGGVLNATCAGQTTWHGFATAIFDEARRHGMRLAVETVEPIAAAQYPTPARRPNYSVLDLTRLNREFGIAPASWRDALTEVMDRLAH